MFTIKRALQWWARDIGDNVALSVDDEECTFAQLYAWAGRVADYLIGLGVKPGDRVGVIGFNSMDYAVLGFGLMRMGGIAATISFRSTASEIADLVDDLKPVFIFSDADRRAVAIDGIGGDAARIISLDEIRARQHGAEVQIDYEPQPDDGIFIIGTSGTTARPKGVLHTHRMVMTYAVEFAITEPECARGASILSVGPFSSSSGWLLLNQYISIGVTMYIESQFKPERALKLLIDRKIIIFLAPPIFFERIAALPEFENASFPALRFTQTAGARIPMSLLAAWRDKGVILRQAYGCTEAGGAWAARLDTAVPTPQKASRGAVFSELAIRDENGGFAPPGQQGEILIRSACMTPGYWNNPEATAKAIQDGWLHTGDIGVMDEGGNVTFIDRLKDIIISGGLNISAAEIENVISELDGVEEVAAISVADKEFGETPLAIIYGDQTKVSAADIVAHCVKRLARYKAPSYVVFESEPLPRVLSGKISKPVLRDKYRDAPTRFSKIR